jgi:hypothetical protein
MPHSQELVGAALSYAGRGWRVLPLWWLTDANGALVCACNKGIKCGRNAGKHPIPSNWGTVATTETTTIQEWRHRWPQANVGLVAGHTSGLAIVDVDPRNRGDESLRELEQMYAVLPTTPLVLSGGGGQHYYFAATEDLPCIDLAPGVNFLADTHHQVVAPPSLHRSGRRYEWEVTQHPEDLPLAPLPDWIRALVLEKVAERTVAAATLPDVLPTVDVGTLPVSYRIKNLILLRHDPVPANPTAVFSNGADRSRSGVLFAVLCALVAAGCDDVTIAGVVLDPNNGISEKPLGQKNQKSPQYWTLTRGWVAQEIARARAKHVAVPPEGPITAGPVAPGTRYESPWMCPRDPPAGPAEPQC